MPRISLTGCWGAGFVLLVVHAVVVLGAFVSAASAAAAAAAAAASAASAAAASAAAAAADYGACCRLEHGYDDATRVSAKTLIITRRPQHNRTQLQTRHSA